MQHRIAHSYTHERAHPAALAVAHLLNATPIPPKHLAHKTRMTYGADVSAGMAAAFNAKAEADGQLRGRMAAAAVSITDAAAVAAAQAAGALPPPGSVEVRRARGRPRPACTGLRKAAPPAFAWAHACLVQLGQSQPRQRRPKAGTRLKDEPQVLGFRFSP